MKKLLPIAAFLLSLAWAQTAQAQYANKSLTIAPGYLVADRGVGFDGAIPLYIGGSLYLEGGFELYTHFPLAIVQQRGQNVLGWGNHTGVRYLLMEDYLRPYVGLELAFLQILGTVDPRISVGPGAIAGVEYFLTPSVSLGVRGQIDLFLSLENAPMLAYGGALTLGLWFN